MHRFARHWFTPHHSNQQRAQVLHTSGLIALGIILLVLHFGLAFIIQHGPFDTVLGYSSEISVDKVYAQVNAQRQASGKKTLQLSSALNAAAQAKAADMFVQQYWAHRSPSGTEPWAFISRAGYRYTVAGENLGKNFQQTDSLVQAWMASATHRANILNDRYSETGIAVLNGTLQGTETTLVVQMFATPQAAAVKPKATKPVVKPQAEVAPQTLVAAAPEESNTVVLGDETAPNPIISPHNLVRWVIGGVLAALIALLLFDMQVVRPKKHSSRYGKSLAHAVLLGAVLMAVVLASSAGVLL